MKNLLVIFLLALCSVSYADDLTSATLKQCGVVEYKGRAGASENFESFVSGGRWYFYETSDFPTTNTSVMLTSATLRICNETGKDFDQATNPYYGLSYDNKIASYCRWYLESAGYGKDLCDGIISNAVAVNSDRVTSATLAGCLLSSVTLTTAEQTQLDEAAALRALQESAKASAYAKYPKE